MTTPCTHQCDPRAGCVDIGIRTMADGDFEVTVEPGIEPHQRAQRARDEEQRAMLGINEEAV